jgi:hypothetical protein
LFVATKYKVHVLIRNQRNNKTTTIPRWAMAIRNHKKPGIALDPPWTFDVFYGSDVRSVVLHWCHFAIGSLGVFCGFLDLPCFPLWHFPWSPRKLLFVHHFESGHGSRFVVCKTVHHCEFYLQCPPSMTSLTDAQERALLRAVTELGWCLHTVPV